MSTDYHKEVISQIRAEVASSAYKLPSPAMDALGGSIIDFLPMRSIHCDYPVSALHAGIDGNITLSHLAAAAEATTGLLAAHLTGHPCMAVNFNMNHLRPAGVNEGHITVEAKTINRTKSVVNIETKVWNAAGRAIASGDATLTVSKPKPRS